MIDVNIIIKRDKFDVLIKEQFDNGITGIYGPSGSGKTSLLHAISGLLHPQKGSIKIDDAVVFSSDNKTFVPVNKRNIGYVFQEGRLFPHMTIKKNLMYGKKKNEKQLLSFDEVVELLQLKLMLDRKPSSVSGGERQRTALGRALLSNPRLLLLDEPFSAVDVRLREQILPFLIRIHKKTQIPLLVVSHDITDLLKLTNRLCIIKQGRIVGHDLYHRLIKQTEIQNIFTMNSILNSISLKVLEVQKDKGIAMLGKLNSENPVKVLCEKSNQEYRVGEELKIFINSDDIALSTKPLTEVTIQNQLKGTITDLLERDQTMLCIVDVGFSLVVEITKVAMSRMDIHEGMTVWCLFKSVAIDVAG